MEQREVKSMDRDQFLRDTESLMFSSCTNEHEYTLQSSWIEGQIPPDIKGTYLRNGASASISGRGSRSPLDGDGRVISLSLKHGKAFFKSRFVRTHGFEAEQRAGRQIYRSPFSKGSADGSLLFNPFDLRFKNVANTNVVHWNGKLFALWEAGKPYELDPRTLETIGESRLGGILSSSHDPIAGHYRILHPPPGSTQQGGVGKRLVLFGTDVTLSGMSVKFLEIDERGRCINRVDHSIGGIDTTFIVSQPDDDANEALLLLAP
jgi:all-trans-8'-apo-beta-carotenal 15,15'-oxygenase